ncbi:MAG: FecR family protein [Proteobacteria bacterium]|nr:FecR family protein [Pseudomonadota bacterium]
MKLLLSILFLFGAAAKAADAPVGEVSFLIGSARVAAGPDSPRDLVRGDRVSAGQVIETGDNGHVHLRFVDDGTVAIRPQSRLRIEDFHYDPANPRENRIKFSLEQGTLRSITGRAGEAAKDRYRLNTPIAAIGIKGTDFIVQVVNDTTRVAVNSGAIVLAPLGEGCPANALGACSTAGARELSAAMVGRYLELKARYSVPELIQIDPSSTFPDRTSLSDDAKGGRARRPTAGAGSIAASAAGEGAPPLAAPANTSPPAGSGSGSNAGAGTIATTITDTTARATLTPVVTPKPVPTPVPVPEPTPTPTPTPVPTPIPTPIPVPTPIPTPIPTPAPPPVALPDLPVVPQIWWGRWGDYANSAASPGSATFADQFAVPGRETATGNTVFGMFREQALVTRLPETGTASFSLARSEVYVVQGKQLTAAAVVGANLSMDFDARRFTTALSVLPSDMSVQNLTSKGFIQADGRFNSDGGQAMNVLGAITYAGGQQAGYVFQQSLDAGKMLSGATLWVR